MFPTLKYTRLQMSVISMIPRRGFWPRPNPLTNTAFSCPIFSPSPGKRGFLCLSPAPGPSIGQREILIFPDLLFQRGDEPLKLARPHFALRQRKGRVSSPAPDDGRRAYRRRGDAGRVSAGSCTGETAENYGRRRRSTGSSAGGVPGRCAI